MKERERLPTLQLNVATIASYDRKTYGYVVRLEVVEAVKIMSRSFQNEIAHATIWEASMNYGSAPREKTATEVGKVVSEMMGEFVKDWRTANRK